MVEFSNFSLKEERLVSKIAKRAVLMGISHDHLDTTMDISACNVHRPLDLEKLAKFNDADFAHDIMGIYQHLNRMSGRLKHQFLPRCAKPVAVTQEVTQ